jgi:adhesin/invasin
VIVKDANGNPKPDVSVTFTVASGGGSVTGATVSTNSSGIATVGSWTLGPVVGTNVLNAATGSLGGVSFTATSIAGAAASLAKNSGDNQAVQSGTAVPTPPSVIVRDANGNPKSGVTVTFAVASGGGSITGASAVTNASGVAAVGSWTVGTTPGVNTMSASVAGLSSVTFTAT